MTVEISLAKKDQTQNQQNILRLVGHNPWPTLNSDNYEFLIKNIEMFLVF